MHAEGGFYLSFLLMAVCDMNDVVALTGLKRIVFFLALTACAEL